MLGDAVGFVSSGGDYEYHIFRGQQSWNDADHWCSSRWGGAGPHGQLATFATETDMNEFTRWMQTMAKSDMYSDTSGIGIWIGYSDLAYEGKWLSVDGSNMGSFLNWKPDQPDNWNNVEHCAEIANHNMQIADMQCDYKRYYACSLYGECNLPASNQIVSYGVKCLDLEFPKYSCCIPVRAYSFLAHYVLLRVM